MRQQKSSDYFGSVAPAMKIPCKVEGISFPAAVLKRSGKQTLGEGENASGGCTCGPRPRGGAGAARTEMGARQEDLEVQAPGNSAYTAAEKTDPPAQDFPSVISAPRRCGGPRHAATLAALMPLESRTPPHPRKISLEILSKAGEVEGRDQG